MSAGGGVSLDDDHMSSGVEGEPRVFRVGDLNPESDLHVVHRCHNPACFPATDLLVTYG
jgi:hypothetical protein